MGVAGDGEAGLSRSVRKSAESRSGRRRTAPPRILRAIERSREPYESATEGRIDVSAGEDTERYVQ